MMHIVSTMEIEIKRTVLPVAKSTVEWMPPLESSLTDSLALVATLEATSVATLVTFNADSVAIRFSDPGLGGICAGFVGEALAFVPDAVSASNVTVPPADSIRLLMIRPGLDRRCQQRGILDAVGFDRRWRASEREGPGVYPVPAPYCCA